MEGHGQVRMPPPPPPKFIAMVQQFQDGMSTRVLDNGVYSQPFPVTNGVKQGWVLACTLFSMMFSAMLTDAFCDCDIGVSFRYRTDKKVFNPQRLQARTKVHKDTALDFLFANDCALNACTQTAMQGSMDLFTKACDDFGLTISIKKTEVLHQPAPSSSLHRAYIYLGGTLSCFANIDEQVAYRIARASTAFGRLKDNVCERGGLSYDTKLKVYRAVVLESLLYACETWTVYSQLAKQLNVFHMRCLRTLLRVTWCDRVPDTDVLQRAKMESIRTILKHSQLQWAGHVHCMDDCRLPKRLLYSKLSTGKRSLGRPKLRYQDTLKASLKQCGIPYTTWEESTEDRPAWRSLVKSGVATFEERRIRDKEKKRQSRKDTENSSSKPGSVYSSRQEERC